MILDSFAIFARAGIYFIGKVFDKNPNAKGEMLFSKKKKRLSEKMFKEFNVHRKCAHRSTDE